MLPLTLQRALGVGGLTLARFSPWHNWLLTWPHDTIFLSPKLPSVYMSDSADP